MFLLTLFWVISKSGLGIEVGYEGRSLNCGTSAPPYHTNAPVYHVVKNETNFWCSNSFTLSKVNMKFNQMQSFTLGLIFHQSLHCLL